MCSVEGLDLSDSLACCPGQPTSTYVRRNLGKPSFFFNEVSHDIVSCKLEECPHENGSLQTNMVEHRAERWLPLVQMEREAHPEYGSCFQVG